MVNRRQLLQPLLAYAPAWAQQRAPLRKPKFYWGVGIENCWTEGHPFAAFLTQLMGSRRDGKKLFAVNCSVGYCHGAEGRAGRGIANSSMPACHGRLTGGRIGSIVEYILSISKEVTHTDSAGAVEIRMKDRETIRGLVAEQNASKVRIYDLTSPAQRRAAPGAMGHENIDSTYTKKQLADLIGFVKSAPVRVEELF